MHDVIGLIQISSTCLFLILWAVYSAGLLSGAWLVALMQANGDDNQGAGQ